MSSKRLQFIMIGLLRMCFLIPYLHALAEDPSNHICASTSPLEPHILSKCEEKIEENGLQRVFLTKNVTCNDGSRAGFYIRKSNNNKRWIIYLEGGWYCYDEESCMNRLSKNRYLMSSEQWPPFRSGYGILSNDRKENPYWWDATHVFVPYCTSDIWSGRKSESHGNSSFSFMGALIVKQVVKELLHNGLKKAHTLILAGSSAGGIGVMLNLEPIEKLLKRYNTRVKIRGITDSGWFLDQTSSEYKNTVGPVESVKQGFTFWRSQIPHNCRVMYPHQLWNCFIGYRLYPTLSVPLFVFQWLFDEVQLKMEDVDTPITKQQWEHIHNMGDGMRTSLENVTSVFAPSCISHSILTRKDWQHIKISDVSLPEALRCWELRTKNQFENEISPQTSENTNTHRLSNFNNATRRNSDHPRRRRVRKKERNDKNVKVLKRRNKEKNRLFRSTIGNNRNICAHRLIERCSWPQCNNFCPKLQNPVTGEELDFMELLKSFGLDMLNVAQTLGVDMHTLRNMGQREWISLLTQRDKVEERPYLR